MAWRATDVSVLRSCSPDTHASTCTHLTLFGSRCLLVCWWHPPTHASPRRLAYKALAELSVPLSPEWTKYRRLAIEVSAPPTHTHMHATLACAAAHTVHGLTRVACVVRVLQQLEKSREVDKHLATASLSLSTLLAEEAGRMDVKADPRGTRALFEKVCPPPSLVPTSPTQTRPQLCAQAVATRSFSPAVMRCCREWRSLLTHTHARPGTGCDARPSCLPPLRPVPYRRRGWSTWWQQQCHTRGPGRRCCPVLVAAGHHCCG